MARTTEAGAGVLRPAHYLLAGFALAVVLVTVALLLSMGGHMFGGGMMGPGPQGDGGGLLVATLLVLGVAAAALALWKGGLLAQSPRVAPPGGERTATADPVRAQPGLGANVQSPPVPKASQAAAIELEAMALRLLDRDERLLFLEIKDRGGAALQKDIGTRDGFSRSKVTRLLDRLEAKGLIAREREGMTNRVRLLTRPGGGA